MIDVNLEVVRYTGSHGQFGYDQGRKLKDSQLIKAYQLIYQKKKKTNFMTDLSEATAQLARFHAPLIKEIYGLRDGLKISKEEALALYAGYYIEVNKSGCSILATDDFFVRNYDSHPESYEGRFVMYQPTDGGYRSMGPAMQVVGRTDGINECGLVVGYNFTNRIRSGDGFICQMIARMILEKAGDVHEAVALLKQLPHRRSFSYVLKDERNEAVVVEASSRRVVTRVSNVCTNHFHILEEDNRYQYDESKKRLAKLIKVNGEHPSILDAYQSFNGDENGIFATDYQYSSGTLHTTVYEPKTRSVLIGAGKQKRPVKLSLAELDEQKAVVVKKIKGQLDWRKPYLSER